MSVAAFAAKPLTAAYLALRLPAGTEVTYHGTATEDHGRWTVRPCSCGRCVLAVLRGLPATRYELWAQGAQRPGVTHVRHTSVRPVVSEDELNETVWATLPTKYVSAHLRTVLRRTFPGVKFSVRTGQGKHAHEITVSWSGGPGRTAVSTVTAPLLATYGAGQRRRPRAVTVTVGGRTRSGMPVAAAIHLNRA
ncbi:MULTISPECIES: LPD29 domain-containing protein [Streptomyces]|uniref:Large polyvalent protein associated domain-containing protein n=1 Tax=Streptomyces sp. F12 TaxID=1436084 RepID=V9Z3P4_9ACTN|nr:LPD29 domain-containing protein [Streptomyces sp. F12]AHE40115.1 Hypothetical protein pFRL6_28 [Streptomyces sp. F12]